MINDDDEQFFVIKTIRTWKYNILSNLIILSYV